MKDAQKLSMEASWGHSPNRACSIGFWRMYKAGPPSLASLALDVRESNKFRTSVIDIDVFHFLLNCSGKVPRPRSLQPQHSFRARCLQNDSKTQFMAPRWHQGTIAPRALIKNKKKMVEKCYKVNLSFEGVLGPRGHGSMREPLEMATASRMQNMVEIRKKNTCFATILFF